MGNPKKYLQALTKQKKNFLTIECITIGQMYVCLFLMAVVVILLAWLLQDPNQRPSQVPSLEIVCINSTDIPGYDTNYISIPAFFSNTTTNDTITYCGTFNEVITWLTEVSLILQYDTASHPESKFYHELIPDTCRNTSSTETVLKLSDLSSEGQGHHKYTNDGQNILRWNNNYTKGNITCNKEEGTITIQYPGQYLVESKVNVEINEPDIRFVHSVYRRSVDGTEERLIENVMSTSDSDSPMSVKDTSIVGAMFVLNQFDRLYVTISSAQFLANDLSGNFFSVYQILYS